MVLSGIFFSSSASEHVVTHEKHLGEELQMIINIICFYGEIRK